MSAVLTGHSKSEANSTYQSLKTYLRFNFPASLLGCSAGPQSRCDAQLQTVVNCGPVRLCVLSTCPQDTLVIGTYIAAGGQRKIFPAVWLVCSEKHSLSVCDRPEVLAAAALLLQGQGRVLSIRTNSCNVSPTGKEKRKQTTKNRREIRPSPQLR